MAKAKDKPKGPACLTGGKGLTECIVTMGGFGLRGVSGEPIKCKTGDTVYLNEDQMRTYCNKFRLRDSGTSVAPVDPDVLKRAETAEVEVVTLKDSLEQALLTCQTFKDRAETAEAEVVTLKAGAATMPGE